MANPLFSIFNGGQAQAAPANFPMNNPMQMAQAMQNMMANPSAFLNAAGYNVPANIMGNPQQIINHLVQTGQVSNQIVQAAMNAFGKRFN